MRERLTEIVTVRFTPSELAELKELADKHGRSVSSVIRQRAVPRWKPLPIGTTFTTNLPASVLVKYQ